MNTNYIPKLLKLADYSDPILRKKTTPVSFPLSEEDRQIIADMIYSIQPKNLIAANAPWEDPVGMAANQWGIDKRIFLYCPSGDTEAGLEVIINPSYEAKPTLAIIAPSEQCEWEGCFSVPLAVGNIKRSTKIKVKYQNVDGVEIEKVLNGFKARVFQHETDHLDGHLYDDPRTGKCLEKKKFKTRSDVEEFYSSLHNERR